MTMRQFTKIIFRSQLTLGITDKIVIDAFMISFYEQVVLLSIISRLEAIADRRNLASFAKLKGTKQSAADYRP